MKRSVFYIFVFFFFIIVYGASLTIDHNSRERDYLSQKLKEEVAFYKTSFSTLSILSEIFLKKLKKDSYVGEILYGEKDVKKINKKIYRRYKDEYQILKRYGIKKIFIYLPDGRIVLRFHNPEKYGDLYNREKRGNISYFTQILYKGKLVGNAEINISFNSARNLLKKTLPAKEFIFLIKKKYLSFKEFDGYIQSEISKDYYYSFASNISNVISNINLKLRDEIVENLKENTNFAVAVKKNGSWYTVSFISIHTLFTNMPRELGYLVSYERDSYIWVIRRSFWMLFFLGNAVIGFILLLMFYRFKEQEKFEKLASIDPLTKIKNRRKFNELAEHEFEKAKRYNRPLSFIIFDIDNFKQINDKYGHQVGDKVLKEIAEIVKKNIRKADIFARFGGEEFVILTPETDIKGAKSLAEKLRKLIETNYIEPVGIVTASFGVTEIRSDDKNIDDLYRRADNALYESKNKGKNTVSIAL